MGVDFADWAVVSFNDDTGLGRMANDLKDSLGIGWHFVSPSERLQDNPLRNDRELLLPRDAPESHVRNLLEKVEGIIVLERSYWHPALLRLARETGKVSVCCPMWEWFKGSDPEWQYCDLFLCTSRHTEKILHEFGYGNTCYIGMWPLKTNAFPKRTIQGPGRLFIHNAGIIDKSDRKGTGDVIRAFQKVERNDIRLIVRTQKHSQIRELRTKDPRIEVRIGNLDNFADLYTTGDVAIQPSKLEGLGFMVVEPQLCGIPTITLDHPPMNEYITDSRMLVRPLPFKRRAYFSRKYKHAYLRLPSLRDLSGKIEWCAENDLSSISRDNQRFSEKNYNIEKIRRVWHSAISGLKRI